MVLLKASQRVTYTDSLLRTEFVLFVLCNKSSWFQVSNFCEIDRLLAVNVIKELFWYCWSILPTKFLMYHGKSFFYFQCLEPTVHVLSNIPPTTLLNVSLYIHGNVSSIEMLDCREFHQIGLFYIISLYTDSG